MTAVILNREELNTALARLTTHGFQHDFYCGQCDCVQELVDLANSAVGESSDYSIGYAVRFPDGTVHPCDTREAAQLAVARSRNVTNHGSFGRLFKGAEVVRRFVTEWETA